jgi:hypothetical protein
MPIPKPKDTSGPGETDKVMARIRAGDAVPILSHSVLFDLALFGHEAFKRYYAKNINYPSLEPPLPDIAQLANFDRYANQKGVDDCNADYLSIVKDYIYDAAEAAGADADTLAGAASKAGQLGVTDFAHQLGYPRFDQQQTFPLQVLANLPFKIYLTLSATTFLEDALCKAGKEPLTRMCRWQGPIDAPEKDLWLIPDDYDPDEHQPLVYHLCGLDAHPRSGKPLPGSLALSEDDHLEMLVNLAEGRGKDNTDRLPALVRGALFQNVLLLGFRLESWAFRGVYYGLIRGTGKGGDRRGACVLQLPPDEREKQEKYLQGYLDREAKFDIIWDGLSDYARKLKG